VVTGTPDPRAPRDREVGRSAIVLAGGRARRFGGPKLDADLAGAPLLHHALRAAAAVCDEIVLVIGSTGDGPALPGDLGVPVVTARDRTPAPGPLVAVLGGAEAARHERLLVIAGDMPGLQGPVLGRLLSWAPDRDGAALAAGGEPQPLPLGLARGPALAAAPGLLADGERSLRALVGRLDLEIVPEPEWRAWDPAAATLRDVDTPDDLAEAGASGASPPGPRAV
jgi:molybdopterin-guanine dinucleotide biosynthesis protein A